MKLPKQRFCFNAYSVWLSDCSRCEKCGGWLVMIWPAETMAYHPAFELCPNCVTVAQVGVGMLYVKGGEAIADTEPEVVA